jgi:hypothetical protein
MTHEEAKAIVSAYQVRKTQASPAEYRQYLEAREVVAKAGGLQMTAGQRGFLASVRRQLSIGEDA